MRGIGMRGGGSLLGYGDVTYHVSLTFLLSLSKVYRKVVIMEYIGRWINLEEVKFHAKYNWVIQLTINKIHTEL